MCQKTPLGGRRRDRPSCRRNGRLATTPPEVGTGFTPAVIGTSALDNWKSPVVLERDGITGRFRLENPPTSSAFV